MPLPAPDSASSALVTGASSGLGEAMARQLAERGYGVTLVARRDDRLRALAEELSGRQGIRAEAVADLTARWLPGMVERGAGAVLVTGSTAAFQPLPGNAIYAAATGLERGKRVVVPGAPNRVLAAIGRFSPRPVVMRVMDST